MNTAQQHKENIKEITKQTTNNSIRPPREYSYMRQRYGAYAGIYYKHYVKLQQMRGIHIGTYLEQHRKNI